MKLTVDQTRILFAALLHAVEDDSAAWDDLDDELLDLASEMLDDLRVEFEFEVEDDDDDDFWDLEDEVEDEEDE